jgi:alpha-glucosidase
MDGETAMTKTHAKADDWWRGAVIYEIYPRSYQDTTGDGSGDLRGITRRLGHIASLGADAIWIAPFFRSPMADMGYDVSDYRDVDPMFGTLADFDALVAEAHRLGVKVIIDQVLSHSSDRHEWFRESRSSRDNSKSDWYVWADPRPDGSPPNNWLSVFGGPSWEWDSVRRQYYLHNFLVSQPDLNFHNEEVQDALLDAVRFWLDRGVDGFRLDTSNFYFHDRRLRSNPPLKPAATETNPYNFQEHVYDKNRPETLGFMRRLRALLDRYGTIAMGEVGEGDGLRSLELVRAYTSGGDRLHMCYTFDMLGPKFLPEQIRKCAEPFATGLTEGWLCWAFSNHDVVRHVTRWTPPGVETDRIAKLSIALLVALRGAVCLYEGEELGLPEAEIAFEDLRDPYGIRFWPGFKGRDGCRTPMVWDVSEPNAGFSTGKPWLPVPAAHIVRAVSAQEGDEQSVLSAYRTMIALRRGSPALRDGDVEQLAAPGHLLAFVRAAGGERVLCLYNLGAASESWPLPSAFAGAAAIAAVDLGARISGGIARMPAFSALFARLP